MPAISRNDLTALCREALLRTGADPDAARVLAEATVEAELVGNRGIGVAHLFDYLDGYQQGRITAGVQPTVQVVAPALIDVDAHEGLAQTAFAAAFDAFGQAVADCGLAALWIKRSFTCGELGYYARHLAAAGLLTVAMANSPALMSIGGAPSPVLGTNPVAYGIPRPIAHPVVIDQASSSTAFVNIRRYAEAGDPLPAGWAVGPDGQPTQDASAAMNGALLPFGSHRGGNIALLAEILATFSGASFSLDAPPFDRGPDSPRIGVFLLAVDTRRFPGSIDRIDQHLTRLRRDFQVRLPAVELGAPGDTVDLDPALLQRLQAAGTPA